MNRRIKFGEPDDKTFMIGTMTNPPNSESQAHDGKWCVNCVNGWAATLGKRLNLENAIIRNVTTALHELTHIMSDIWHIQERIDNWDAFLWKLLEDLHDSKLQVQTQAER